MARKIKYEKPQRECSPSKNYKCSVSLTISTIEHPENQTRTKNTTNVEQQINSSIRMYWRQVRNSIKPSPISVTNPDTVSEAGMHAPDKPISSRPIEYYGYSLLWQCQMSQGKRDAIWDTFPWRCGTSHVDDIITFFSWKIIFWEKKRNLCFLHGPLGEAKEVRLLHLCQVQNRHRFFCTPSIQKNDTE